MEILPKKIKRISEAFARLPGVGPKTASRLTFYLLGRDDEEVHFFENAFKGIKENLQQCSTCHIITEDDPCPVCRSNDRNKLVLAVVEESLDVLAVERARFDGLYHVLDGQISPLNNVSADDLNIASLLNRLKNGKFEEVILATDPSLEGEATAMYIDEQIKNLQQKKEISPQLVVTRLARGLPVGGDLEYADELTLARALEGRKGY